jgi:hypothetical protein
MVNKVVRSVMRVRKWMPHIDVIEIGWLIDCGIDWLIIYGFTSRSRIFHLYGNVTIAGEGLQNLGLCSALRAFDWAVRDLYRAIPAMTRDLSFSGLIRRTAPI